MLTRSDLDSTWLQIGSRRQFFFDDLMLEQVQDVTRRHFRPEKITPEPLIKPDQPWEHVSLFACNGWNVILDPADNLFKCWYEDWQVGDPTRLPSWVNETDGKLCVDMHGVWPSRMCYAQSEDGLHWDKPALGIVREDGRDTNIVLGGREQGLVHCPYVMLDALETDPNKRFKAAFEYRRVERGNDMTGEGGFRIASGPDGIHWNVWDQNVRFGTCGDVLGDVITLSRDPETGVYWANNRHPGMCSSSVQDRLKPVQPSWICPSYPHKAAQDNRRRVYRSESLDLVHWSTPMPLLALDGCWDNIDDQHYGMEQFQVGDDWVGFLNVFHATENHLDVQLTHSRDGRRFTRIHPGRPWLATGMPQRSGGWDSVEVTCPSKPVVVGDELFVYYSGAVCHHDWWITGAHEGLDVPEATDTGLVSYAMGLARMKRDRFVSISSGAAREGLVVTPAVFPRGRRLIINARTHGRGGAIRVAVADGQDRVLEGYGKEDCVPFTSDAVGHEVAWRAGPDMPSQSFMKLHFYLQNAELFSFQFVE